MRQNIYLCYDAPSTGGVLIDAGCGEADIQALTAFIQENNIAVKAILLTHGHFDHIVAAEELKRLFFVPLYCHVNEMEIVEDPAVNLSALRGTSIATAADGTLNDGDVFSLGGTTLRVIHTPGHTPGGVCYYDKADGNLFTGDTLFRQSVGRTDLPAGDYNQLINSIKDKLLPLPDGVNVYPGHGPSTTIGHERHHNPFIGINSGFLLY